MHSLSGGCHYFHGCNEWKKDCINCPQLIGNFVSYPAKILSAKKKYFNFANITIVALSHHSRRIIEKSIYKNCRIEVIPNSIEIDIFIPTDKIEAKKIFNLPLNKKIIFFLPSYHSTIKGMNELNQALDILKDKKDEYHLLVAGSGALTFKNDNFTITRLGPINDNNRLALAYSASDVTIVPSLEETFSNTTAESISCGTPVIGFKIAGLPDMIQDGYNGYTVELGDIKGLADSIHKVLNAKNMSKNCREYAEKNLKLDLQAIKYKKLYKDLLEKPVEVTSKQSNIPEVFEETAPTLIELLNKSIVEQKNIVKDKDKSIVEQKNIVKAKDKSIVEQKNIVKAKDKSIVEQKNIVKAKDKKLNLNIKELQEKNKKINSLISNKWYRFGQMSRKRKIWIIGKVLSKKLKLYWIFQPIAKKIKDL